MGKVQSYLDALTVQARATVESETKQAVISAADVVRMLTEIAKANIMDFLRDEPGGPLCSHCGRGGPGRLVVDPREAIRKGKGGVIKRLRLGKDHGSIEVHDRLNALLALARIYGLFDGGYQAEAKERAEARWTRAIELLPADVVKQVHLALLEASNSKPY